MALSDAYADFLTALCDGEGSPKELVRELVKENDGYDGEPCDEREITALREACRAFLAIPAGVNSPRKLWLAALVRLVMLAEQTRAYHDTPPSRAEVEAALRH